MAGPLSVTMSDIYMVKMEIKVVRPLKLLFYSRYMDDIYNRRKKDGFDKAFHALSNNHGHQKYQSDRKETQLQQIYTEQDL